MKGFVYSVLSLALVGQMAFAAGTAFQTDTVSIGNGKSSATDKLLKFNNGATTPPTIKLNGTSGRLQFANDGANFIDIGSGAGGSGGGINLLTLNNANPDMELGNTGWTISGGSIATVTSGSNLGNGKTSLSWTPSGSAQTFSSAQFAVIGGAMGKSCMGKFYYKTAESTNPYILNVLDGSSNLLATYTLPATSVFSDGYATFPCPSSGNLYLQLKTSASAPTNPIYLDDAHLGTNYLAGSVSQATFYGGLTYPTTAGCTWAPASTGNVFTAFPAQSSCSTPAVTGNASAPATKLAAVTFATLPPGDYLVVSEGQFSLASSGTPATATYQIYDGTTGEGMANGQSGSASPISLGGTLIGRFSYATAQTNITFQLRAASTTDSNVPSIYANGSNATLNFRVYRFPTSSDTVFRPDSTPASWSGYLTNTGGWATTAGTWADPSAGTGIVLTQLTNRNFGTVSTAASSLPGITFTAPRIGNYRVCALTSFLNAAATNSIARLVDGSGGIIDPGQVFTLASGAYGTVPLCGQYQVSSVGASTTFKVQMGTSGGISMSINGGGAGIAVHWEIIELDAPMPAPVFQGFVGSNTSGQERLERLQFGGNTGTNACTGSPCTVNRQSGAWVSSVTRSSVGTYAVNFAAGEFSAAPTCTCSAGRVSSTWCQVYGESTSGVSVQSVASTGSPAAATLTDDAPSVICMGPR